MKKLLLIATFLLAAVVINAQSLEDIVKKYTAANKLDRLSGIKTVKITANMSMMGMEMPMTMWLKSPNKIKNVMSINGQDMIQVFDGVKGYMVNPMAGSTDPVEMTAEQIKTLTNNNLLNNKVAEYLKDGKLALQGEEAINGKPAFKIKVNIPEASSTMYIDKESYLVVKTSTDINQGGQSMTVESYPSDYTETNGLLLPMKTTSSATGMEMVTTFTKVEVDIPVDDSVFNAK